jgi:hypothetical protein
MSVSNGVAAAVGFHLGSLLNQTPANNAPSDIALSETSIAENNAIGVVIGALSTTDADVGDTFVYTLVSGTGSTDNASFTIDGANLKAGIAFDYETKSSYSVRVRSTDAGGLYTEKALTITITDVSEATAPSISAVGTSSIDDTVFTVGATINPNGASTVVTIEYGLTAAYGSEQATVTGSPVSTTGAISAVLSGLAQNTTYHYRVKTVNSAGTVYSDDATQATTNNRYVIPLSSTGNGSGISTLIITVNSNTTMTIDGNGNFYDDSGGITNEGKSRNITTGGSRTFYIKVTSGSCNIVISNGITKLTGLNNWVSSTNAATWGGVLLLTPIITYFRNDGNSTISGTLSLPSGITYFAILGNNTISGTLSLPSELKVCKLLGNNTVSDYTASTVSPTLDQIIFKPASGGLSSSEVDQLLIDASAATTWEGNKIIDLRGTNAARTSASNSAVSSIQANGVSVLTN